MMSNIHARRSPIFLCDDILVISLVGNEDHAYEIVNSTIPCLDTYVERGVLARVAGNNRLKIYVKSRIL